MVGWRKSGKGVSKEGALRRSLSVLISITQNLTAFCNQGVWAVSSVWTPRALLNQDQSACVPVSLLAQLLFFQIVLSLNKGLPSRGICKFFIIPIKHAVISEPGVVEDGQDPVALILSLISKPPLLISSPLQFIGFWGLAAVCFSLLWGFTIP